MSMAESTEHGASPPGVSGVALIAAERQRQIDEEGWIAPHDDRHTDAQLAWAAACYAAPRRIYVVGTSQGINEGEVSWYEPWPRGWRREPGCGRVRELVKAGALIAAEIDRLSRLPAADTPPRMWVKDGPAEPAPNLWRVDQS